MLSSFLLAAGLASTLLPATAAADGPRALTSLVKDCKFAINDYKFNLCPLFEKQEALQHTIVFDTQTPPTVTKTVYKLSLDGPLPQNEKLPEHEQCPDGTWFCMTTINRRPEHESEDPRVLQVVPVVGTNSSSSGVNGKVGVTASMKKSDGKTHPYLLVRMTGGHYVDKPQNALLAFGCNHKSEEPTRPSHLWNWNGTHVFTWMTKHACAHAHAADSAPDAPPADAPNDELIGSPPERYWTSKHSLTTVLLCTVAVLFGLGYTLLHPPPPLRRRMAPFIRRFRRSRFSSAIGESKLLRWAQEDLPAFDEEDEMVNARGSPDVESWDEQIPLKPSPKSPVAANYGTAQAQGGL